MTKALLLTAFGLLSYDRAVSDSITISGRVSSINGIPQAGVNVLLKGTPVGASTDINGYFTLVAPEGKAVLLFAFVRRKAVEHAIILQQGFQYQVNVALSHKTQTFNKSVATTAILPADAGVIRGHITDQENASLSGVIITQSNNGFNTLSDSNGNFTLPIADGKVLLTFRRNDSKELVVELESDRGLEHNLEVTLVKETMRQLQSHYSFVNP